MIRTSLLVRIFALVLSVSCGVPCGASAHASTLRLFPLSVPAGTRLDGSAVDDRGDVAVGYSYNDSDDEQIASWNGTRFVPRSFASQGIRRDADAKEGVRKTLEMPIFFGPDGTLYLTRSDVALACAGPCTAEHVLVAVHESTTTFVHGTACGSKADGLSPVAASADGRVAAIGDFDISAPTGDVFDESLVPIGVLITGRTCHDIGAGSISTLGGTFAAGSQKYIGNKKASPYFEDSTERSVAIRWNGSRSSELGPGIVNGVNASGVCVGNDGGSPVVWRNGTEARLESRGKTGDAVAITESGRTIVGNLGVDAVRWRDGQARTLDSLAPQRRGWHLSKVSGMTPNGTIFGTAERGSRLAVFALTAR